MIGSEGTLEEAPRSASGCSKPLRERFVHPRNSIARNGPHGHFQSLIRLGKDKYCFEGTRSETYLSSPSCERKETVSLASKDGYL